MFKSCLVSFLFAGLAFSQANPTRHIVAGPVLPASCSMLTGDVFLLTTGSSGLYQCIGTSWLIVAGGGGGGGAVSSVFGRTGNVMAASGDYTAAQVTGAVDAGGTYLNPTWLTGLAWTKISSVPSNVTNAIDSTGSYTNPAWLVSIPYSKLTSVPTMVNSFNSRTGAVVPVSGDYTAAMVTNSVSILGSYSDPSWLTALAWAKLTGVPSSFTPSAHASTHAFGASDPVTLTEAQITNLTSDLALKAPLASPVFTGTPDSSGATHTLPVKKGLLSAIPGTCTVGELYFATDATAGQNIYECAATNTFTQQLTGGGGSPAFSAVTAGTNTAALAVGTGGTLVPSGTGKITSNALTSGTIASIPTCSTAGQSYFVTDGTTPADVATGGGSVGHPAYCDGTSWKSPAKPAEIYNSGWGAGTISTAQYGNVYSGSGGSASSLSTNAQFRAAPTPSFNLYVTNITCQLAVGAPSNTTSIALQVGASATTMVDTAVTLIVPASQAAYTSFGNSSFTPVLVSSGNYWVIRQTSGAAAGASMGSCKLTYVAQ